MSCGCDDCGADNIQLDVVNGDDGLSVIITSSTSDPSAAPANGNGGIHYNTDTEHVWTFPTGGSAWADMGSYAGVDGDDGDDGSSVEVTFDTADPVSPGDDPGTGNSGIWYNTTTGHVWFFAIGDAWVDEGAYRGADGADGAGYGGTSTSSMTIGTGSRTFTTQTGLAYLPGLRIRAANDGSNWMEGAVTAYNPGTGSLTFTSALTLGSGTFAVWNIGIAGEQGATGTGSPGVPGTTPTVRSGTGVPSNSLGVNGDEYIQQINLRFLQWYQKSSGAYAAFATGFIRVPGHVGPFAANPNLLGLGTNFNSNDFGFQNDTVNSQIILWTWNGSLWVASISWPYGTGGGTGAFDVYRRIDGAGGTDIRVFGGSGGVAVPFGTPVLLDATSFTNVNDTTHEVESPGRYHIEANVGVVQGSGNPRVTVWLERSTGAGPYTEITGSRMSAYSSGEKNEDGTAHTSIIASLVGNDRIRVMASAGKGNVRQMLERNRSSISIMKVG